MKQAQGNLRPNDQHSEARRDLPEGHTWSERLYASRRVCHLRINGREKKSVAQNLQVEYGSSHGTGPLEVHFLLANGPPW